MGRTTAITYTGTSIALAMPDTSAGVRALAVSMPSVITTTARRRPVRVATRSRRLRNGIVQRGGPERIDLPQRAFRARVSTVNGATSCSRLSKENSAASSRPCSNHESR